MFRSPQCCTLAEETEIWPPKPLPSTHTKHMAPEAPFSNHHHPKIFLGGAPLSHRYFFTSHVRCFGLEPSMLLPAEACLFLHVSFLWLGTQASLVLGLG